MNKHFTITVFLFILLMGAIQTHAQEYRGKEVTVKTINESNPNEIIDVSKSIEIYIFLGESYAKRSLEELKAGKRVTHAENNNKPYHPDKDGKLKFEMPFERGHAIFWCTDTLYKPKHYILSYGNIGSRIEFEKTEEEIELSEADIVGAKTKAALKPTNTASEGPDGMKRSCKFNIPYKISNDMRIVVQPVLYDRSDISDVDSDTIFAFGRATYLDMSEYDLTQQRRMNFDSNNDSLISIIKTQGDTLFHNDIMEQSIGLRKDTTIKDTIIRSAIIRKTARAATFKNDTVIGISTTTTYSTRHGVGIKSFLSEKDSVIANNSKNDSTELKSIERCDTITDFWRLKQDSILIKDSNAIKNLLADAVVKVMSIKNKERKNDTKEDDIERTIKTIYTTLGGEEIKEDIILIDALHADSIKCDTIKIEEDDVTDNIIDAKPYLKIKNDTIYFYSLDRFRGFDPDTSHPYPYGVSIAIDGYNSEIFTTDFKDNGERRSPLRFLDFSFKEFLPNSEMFQEKLEDERFDCNGELKLNFPIGKAVLAANDTASYSALNRLEQQLRAAQNPENGEELHHVKIHGIASPEGNLARNEALAFERAEFAKRKIQSYLPKGIEINNDDTDVAGWDVLADSLIKGGYEELADTIKKIVEKFPVGEDRAHGFAIQQREISKLPEYSTIIKNEFLPKLRTVKYKYVINKLAQLPTDTIISRFRRDPQRAFTKGDYWALFNNLKDERELENAAKIALQKTRKFDADSQYCKGYWAYAASVLACCYIKRDTIDTELLKPFLDFELDSTGHLKDPYQVRSEYDNTKVVGYTNYPDMAANQLIMVLNSKENNSRDIASLEGLIENRAKEDIAYEQLLAFSMCLRGKYNETEEKYVRARELVAKTSTHNYVVMALAMDNPATKADDNEWLKKAVEKIDSLENNTVTKYLKSIINVRLTTDTLLNKADTLLSECFFEDIKYLMIGSNDRDLICSKENKHNVFRNATRLWSEKMNSLNLDESNAYTWFAKGIAEASKEKEMDEEEIRKNLNKCFSLDERYITILNIYMRDDTRLKDKKELLAVLRRIRNEYIEKKNN